MTTETKPSKATKIIYWVSTVLIALPALPGVFMLFFNMAMAKAGADHLHLSLWLGYETSIGSTIGGLVLLIPGLKRLREWVYVAFGIMYLSALVGHITVDGFGAA